MKKIYLQPKAEILTIEAQPILSESFGGNKGTFDSNNQTQLSRESDWDE